MDDAAYDAELDRWIEYLDTMRQSWPEPDSTADILIEQIDKAERRGVISSRMAYDLYDTFDDLLDRVMGHPGLVA